MDVNTIEEILVKFKDGREYVFKRKGLEKFRKDIIKSPPLGGTQQRHVVDTDDAQTDGTPVSIDEAPVSKIRGTQAAPPAQSRNETLSQMKGYHVTSLNYSPAPANSNPYELARQMELQAKQQGMNFTN